MISVGLLTAGAPGWTAGASVCAAGGGGACVACGAQAARAALVVSRVDTFKKSRRLMFRFEDISTSILEIVLSSLELKMGKI
jgi:hypothetical protein